MSITDHSGVVAAYLRAQVMGSDHREACEVVGAMLAVPAELIEEIVVARGLEIARSLGDQQGRVMRPTIARAQRPQMSRWRRLLARLILCFLLVGLVGWWVLNFGPIVGWRRLLAIVVSAIVAAALIAWAADNFDG